MAENTDNGCKLFEICVAPLCPLQENAVMGGIWYPDETICRARKFQSPPWVKKQKRIANLGLTPEDGFFTVRMLDSLDRTTKSLKGADPDDIDSEAKWLKQRDRSAQRSLRKDGTTRLRK